MLGLLTLTFSLIRGVNMHCCNTRVEWWLLYHVKLLALTSLLMTSYTGLTSLNESSTSSLSWSAGVWRTKLRSTWASIALRLPPSAADIYDQPTSISWLCRAVRGLHLAVGLSLLQDRRSGTHYQLSFVVCLSVLVTLDACLRQYCLHDISALSA